MKILVLLASFGFTSLASAQAMNLSCGTRPGLVSQGRHVAVKAKGHWEVLGFNLTRLSYELQYSIDCVPGESCWASAQAQGAGLLANLHYRPIRYHQYQQFVLGSMPFVDQGSLLLPEQQPSAGAPFQAYLMLDAVYGSFGTTVPLQCQGTAVASLSTVTSDSAMAEISRADRIIQEEYALPHLHLQVDRKILQEQIDAGKTSDRVSLSRATELAMATIFNDYDGAETPLRIAADGWAETHEQPLTGKLNLGQKVEIREFLREHMQNPRAVLSLYLGSTMEGHVYPPEQGERVEENWIFFLSLPTLSDHFYWVIVDRRGQTAPYLYGFN